MRISSTDVSVDHEAALDILRSKLYKGNLYDLFAVPSADYPNLMSIRDPKAHAESRKKIGSAYLLGNILLREYRIDQIIHLIEIKLDAVSNKPVELGKWLHCLTWDLIGEITFSERFGFLDQGRDVNNALANTRLLTWYVTLMAYMPWLHALLLGNPILRWLGFEPHEHIYKTCKKAVELRKSRWGTEADMLSTWELMQAQHDKLSDKAIFAAVIGNIGAGGEMPGPHRLPCTWLNKDR